MNPNMKLKDNRAALRLRRTPANTVVHTPTEAEAKELLAILHENGYRSHLHGIWNMFKDETVIFVEKSWINFGNLLFYKNHKEYTILTLAEFKERYCKEEKPQPKFKVDDIVAIRWINKWGRIINVHFSEEAEEWEYNIKVYPKGLATALESNLEPYTAWMKWQEEQIKYKVHLMLDAKPECPFSSEADSYEFAFRTASDRDKCIEEIKAIIEKYSKE